MPNVVFAGWLAGFHAREVKFTVAPRSMAAEVKVPEPVKLPALYSSAPMSHEFTRTVESISPVNTLDKSAPMFIKGELL